MSQELMTSRDTVGMMTTKDTVKRKPLTFQLGPHQNQENEHLGHSAFCSVATVLLIVYVRAALLVAFVYLEP